MQKCYISNNNKHLLLVPFLYTYFSRVRWPRNFLVNMITSWVPGIILVALQAELGAIQAVQYFFAGYMLFVCIYEIGYLVNDSYAIRNDSTPRRRVDIDCDLSFVAIFVLVRTIAFVLIAAWFGVIAVPLFWVSYAVLTAVLLIHNTVRRVELKFFSFLQLSMLRFSLPVFLALLIFDRPDEVFVTLLAGLMLFTYPRVVTYMDAKGRLIIPERKQPTFLMLSLLTVLPFVSMVSVVAHTWAPISVWLWMLIVQIVYVFVLRIRVLSYVKRQFDSNDE